MFCPVCWTFGILYCGKWQKNNVYWLYVNGMNVGPPGEILVRRGGAGEDRVPAEAAGPPWRNLEPEAGHQGGTGRSIESDQWRRSTWPSRTTRAWTVRFFFFFWFPSCCNLEHDHNSIRIVSGLVCRCCRSNWYVMYRQMIYRRMPVLSRCMGIGQLSGTTSVVAKFVDCIRRE